MRWGLIALLALGSARADAEPLAAVEWSAFFGADKLPKDLALGGSMDPEQRPQSGPMLGGRLLWLPLRSQWVAAGVEGELALTTTWTGYGFESRRQSYFAPILGYRAQAVVRLFPDYGIEPHLLAGGGGASTASYSPYMDNDTAGVYYWGAGITMPVAGWQLRIDGRQVWVPVTSGDRAASYEIQIGVGRIVGAKPHRDVVDEMPVVPPEPKPPLVITPPPPPPPPPDPDGDGITGDADHCPNEPEDKDGFEDADGCPDKDNDTDGIPDAADKCPNEPETRNGWQDTDGCPDELPAAMVAAFEGASAVRFDKGKARISKAGQLALAKTLKVLRDNPNVKVAITGHDKDAELAKKRAEAVKWYLVDQGIAQDQIVTTTAEAAKAPISITTAP